MKLSPPYSMLAYVYDQIGADRHSIRMVEYTLSIFRRFNIAPARGLDLCCGTGTALELFQNHGIAMSGLDGSAEMLAVAGKKLKGRRVRLYQKTLPKFRILSDRDSRTTKTFDFITCFYDSLNYLRNARELQTAFRSVAKHLDPAGWFIFDMNTPRALKTIWGGQVYADALDDIAWVWKNEYDKKTDSASVAATVFKRRGRTWERFDELHTEQAYSNTRLKQMLRQAGFEIRGFYRCGSFHPAARTDSRVCAVARKKP